MTIVMPLHGLAGAMKICVGASLPLLTHNDVFAAAGVGWCVRQCLLYVC